MYTETYTDIHTKVHAYIHDMCMCVSRRYPRSAPAALQRDGYTIGGGPQMVANLHMYNMYTW